MRGEDIFMDLRATLDEIRRPWAAFIGLIELKPSVYVDNDNIYALNPQWSAFSDKQQYVILHPDTVPKIRAIPGCEKMSDHELAAMLYWKAMKK